MAPRVLIFGTGAIGSVYTWVLSRQIPAENLVCICRSNYTAAKSNGFTINSTLWGDNLNVKPQVVRTIDDAVALSAQPFDYILVTNKVLPTTPTTASLLRPAVAPEKTTIVLIQNGIDIEPSYSTLYPSNPLLSAVVYLPATQTAPATTSHAEIELLHVGTYPSPAPAPHHTAAATAFTSLITACSATAHFHADIQPQRWTKLLVNAAWNPICALTLSRDAELLHPPASVSSSSTSPEEFQSYVHDVMAGIAAVARARGYRSIDDAQVSFQIGRAVKRDLPGVEPSMLADARAGRRLEVDAIVGNVVRVARGVGVDVPLLRGLYVLVSGLDGSFARAAEAEKEKEGV